ncbi:hypothetical protein AA105894_2094 [Asaia spathodeae NBRC 105894]|nr:hypothetical protein AA105894_2094 [Asaia spathodeae NBRC 105894]
MEGSRKVFERFFYLPVETETDCELWTSQMINLRLCRFCDETIRQLMRYWGLVRGCPAKRRRAI